MPGNYFEYIHKKSHLEINYKPAGSKYTVKRTHLLVFSFPGINTERKSTHQL